MMMKHWLAILMLVILSLTLIASATGFTQSTDSRLYPENLVYQGAFRLPDEPPDMFSYAGAGMTFYPDGDLAGPDDGYPGSLYVTGHDWYQAVAEVSIPEPTFANSVADLNAAPVLQELTDIRGDLFGEMEQPRVGLAYLPPQGDQATGKLYFTWSPHLEEETVSPSHGWTELDLSSSAGPWIIAGRWRYLTSDYLFEIPRAWADTYVNGASLATGRYRDGGQAACGPAIFAIAPWQAGNPPAPNTALPNVPLLLYDDITVSEGHWLDGYTNADEWSGAAWLEHGDRSAVIFAGTRGLGDDWYGFANGVVWPEDGPFPEIPPPPYDDRGWWAEDLQAQIIFYDPADLAAVALGEMEAWQPQPYASLSIDEVMIGRQLPHQKYRTGAVAYDRTNGILYITQPHAGEFARTVVHVWRLVD